MEPDEGEKQKSRFSQERRGASTIALDIERDALRWIWIGVE